MPGQLKLGTARGMRQGQAWEAQHPLCPPSLGTCPRSLEQKLEDLLQETGGHGPLILQEGRKHWLAGFDEPPGVNDPTMANFMLPTIATG